MNIDISLIIPCYNAASFLPELLEGIKHCQLKYSWEFIFWDDGSQDESFSLLQEFQTLTPQKRVEVFHSENRGVSFARQSALGRARGDWIIFLDADDLIDFLSYEAMIDYASLHRRDVVWGCYRCFSKICNKNTPNVERPLFRQYSSLEIAKESWEGSMFSLPLWTAVYRRDFLIRNDISFDVRMTFGEDQYFVFLVLNCAPLVAYYERTLYYYRVGHSSLSSQNVKKRIYSLLLIEAKLTKLDSEYSRLFLRYLLPIWLINNAFSLPSSDWPPLLCRKLRKSPFFPYFKHMSKGTTFMGLVKSIAKFFIVKVRSVIASYRTGP